MDMTTQKARETKQRIVRSTRQLIMEEGLENISINKIIKTARSSKGSFYYHFDGLESVLKETFLSVLNESLQPFSYDPSKPLKENVTSYFRELIQSAGNQNEQYALLFLFISKSFQEPSYKRLFQEMKQQIIEENIISKQVLVHEPHLVESLQLLDMMALGVIVHTNLNPDHTELSNLVDRWIDATFEDM